MVGPGRTGTTGEAGWPVGEIQAPRRMRRHGSLARLTQGADTGEVDAIFTTGGTGRRARDVTPEATRSVIAAGDSGHRRVDADQGAKVDEESSCREVSLEQARKCVIMKPAGFARGARGVDRKRSLRPIAAYH